MKNKESMTETNTVSEPKIKAAQVFPTANDNIETVADLKPLIRGIALDSADSESEVSLPSQVDIVEPPRPSRRYFSKRWFMMFGALVLVASVAELVIFIMKMMQQSDWLAGVWLAIFVGIFVVISKSLWQELRGLKLLKRQQKSRIISEKMYQTPAIGLAEKHCLQIAQSLPESYQGLVSSWQGSLDSSYTDNEMLSLFEQQVLAPVDQLAIKKLTQNASAAGIMIAVSPFALLDMFIVLWRNIRMINQISEIYGVRLGYWGRIKLIKNIFHTMVYAGAAEILTDAGNYALGAGITGKLSTRVAQGLGTSVLTTRIGLKAMIECRPMPFLSVTKPNLSVMSKQLLADLKNKIT